jgi:hypothetical protein
MKRLLPLILIGGLGFTAIASAQTPAATASADDQATAVGADTSDNLKDRYCLRETGSRIAAAANAKERRAGKPETHCANASGTSYSQKDIQRTGETDTAAALRKLDPSIR